MNQLEKALELPRGQWPSSVLRQLWDDLKEGITRRGRSLQHETNWLSLAGFVLRPGFGCEGDSERIAELWRLTELGLSHRKEARAQVQWWILWRRVSGGLSSEQQLWILNQAQKSLGKKIYSPAETYRLIGSLERLPIEDKVQLASTLVKQFSKGKIDEATAWAFGRLACRIPIVATSDLVVPADNVSKWFEQLEGIDWSQPKYEPLCLAFKLAGRQSLDSSRNLPDSISKRIIDKLSLAGCSVEELLPLKEYIGIGVNDEQQLFGESLPMGLELLSESFEN